jgi:hypothetical protein
MDLNFGWTLLLNVFFCGFYFLTRFMPIMKGNFEWLDEKPFTFNEYVMQIHNIFGMALHILAIPYVKSNNYIIVSLWNSIIISNVLMMNIAGLYSPHSRQLPGLGHWSVSIILSIISIIGIWEPLYLMRTLWILNGISFSVYFIKK